MALNTHARILGERFAFHVDGTKVPTPLDFAENYAYVRLSVLTDALKSIRTLAL